MDTKSRYAGIQSEMNRLYEGGCLFLCLLSIAEEVRDRPIDLIDAIHICKVRKWLKSDYTVADSLSILAYFTGYSWTRNETQALSVIRDNEYTVCKYNNARTGFTHFRRRPWDTLDNSVTVQEGKIIEYYIYIKGKEIKYA